MTIKLLAVLALLLFVAATVFARRSLQAFRKPNSKPGAVDPVQESWHVESARAVLESLATGTDGLSIEEAADRLSRYGPNLLPEARTRGPLLRFFSQLHNVLI